VAAAALIVTATTIGTRSTTFVLGGPYALAVAVTRVYVADHFPRDAIGSMLCAIAAALIGTGLAALPALRPYLRRLDASTGRHA
jgi:membrane-associated phospholipid phosphatase